MRWLVTYKEHRPLRLTCRLARIGEPVTIFSYPNPYQHGRDNYLFGDEHVELTTGYQTMSPSNLFISK